MGPGGCNRGQPAFLLGINMAFTSAPILKDRLAGLIKTDDGKLQDFWDGIISDSNRAAYAEIVRRLVGRGYTLAQVVQWDDGAEFETDIGLFWCLTKGGALHNYDDKFIAKLDRREELDDVLFLIGGVAVDPAGSTGDVVGHGYLDDSDSIFSTGLNDPSTTTVW